MNCHHEESDALYMLQRSLGISARERETHAGEGESEKRERERAHCNVSVGVILTKTQSNRTFSEQHLIAIFFRRQLLDRTTPEGI